MKKVLLFFLILIYSQNSVCQLKKVSVKTIEKSIAMRTKTFAFETFAAQNTKSFPKLSASTASKSLLSKYNYKTYSEYISTISKTYGSLLKVEFTEALKDTKRNLIFRYKAYYEKTDDVAEIRVYLNPENKFDYILFKPVWFDKYYAANEKAPLNKIETDSTHTSNAHEFVDRTFNNCSKGNFLKLTTVNATRRLANSLTTEKLNAACDTLTKDFGKLIDFNLIEILSDNYRIIYRYKAKFEKTKHFLELRTSTNMEHKFMGIYCKDKWFDKYYEDTEEPRYY
jgi:hypothetical protein